PGVAIRLTFEHPKDALRGIALVALEHVEELAKADMEFGTEDFFLPWALAAGTELRKGSWSLAVECALKIQTKFLPIILQRFPPIDSQSRRGEMDLPALG
ncbi:unnamed protein product, partial [Effrenium voratum]